METQLIFYYLYYRTGVSKFYRRCPKGTLKAFTRYVLSSIQREFVLENGLGNFALQVDRLTKMFTLVGRDMVGSAKLGELMSLLRDSFLWSQSPATLSEDKVSRHKLLHLIELQSGDWQLTSSALGYYYPQAEMTTI